MNFVSLVNPWILTSLVEHFSNSKTVIPYFLIQQQLLVFNLLICVVFVLNVFADSEQWWNQNKNKQQKRRILSVKCSWCYLETIKIAMAC